MKSPFPGMDPYLEPYWPGLHTHLVSLATAQLNGKLPDDLVAQAEERLSIESAGGVSRTIAADVSVWEPRGSDGAEGGLAISAPYKLVVEVESVTERFIRILGIDGGQLIAVIEFISPANKIAAGLEKYLQKRDELLGGGVHVIEVDLVRRGNWRGLMRPHVCPLEAVAPYRVTIRVAGGRTAYLYPVSVREPLPSVSIPLRPGEDEVKLDLQPLIEQAYDIGGYARLLDYRVSPDPPLEDDDQPWIEALLEERS
jgi:hypothetical protein